MAHILTNDELNSFLEVSWDDLCCFAYENFLNYGQGFIGVDRTLENDDYQLMYTIISDDSLFDNAIKTMVENYNADSEMVLYFACDHGQFRTVLLKSSNNRCPESVWVERNFKRTE